MAHILLNPALLGLVAYSLRELEDLLRGLPISLSINRRHILDKDAHDFNDECGEDCIIYVVEKIKASLKIDIVNENVETPAFESREVCRHGCTIAVRVGLSNKDYWKIGTAYHVYPCLAKGRGRDGFCLIN
jgi:hypothetical protein